MRPPTQNSELKTKNFGSWPSPLSAELIASSNIGLGAVALDGHEVYWIEARPAEGGRNVVVRRQVDDATVDVTPAPFSARSRVHEYGGGAFAVAGGDVCFTHFADQQVYLQRRGGEPQRLTAAPQSRFADYAFDAGRGRLVCVCEEHRADGAEPENLLVSVRLDGGGVRRLASGHDFYASPRLSRDGAQLAWLTWDHPQMPWDGTRLWVAAIGADGELGEARCIAGGETESIFQPSWSPDGGLVFVSDRTGFWNLYRWNGDEAEALCPMAADFGMAQWVFGQSTYGFESASRLVCAFVEQGRWRLGRLDPRRAGACVPYDLPFVDVASVQATNGKVVFIGSSPEQPAAIVELDPASGTHRVLRRSSEIELDPACVSRAETIAFPTADGETAYAFFYAPTHREYQGPASERPPLLVMSHGGPTSSTSSSLSAKVQYWTTRGIAVLDVNYRGSTGFGRAYRESLRGRWGIADVDDCVNGARAMVAAGRVDGRRLAITGGSAGGYTTLCALTFRDVFAAGASYYGIGDLEALAQDTHKFESRYEESLVGPYPERRDLYRERSPIHFVERLSCPVIFFQGLDDRVVPPNQAEKMVAALRAKGLAVEYLPFEGEGHGFRRAETIRRAIEAELRFYARVFGFVPAD